MDCFVTTISSRYAALFQFNRTLLSSIALIYLRKSTRSRGFLSIPSKTFATPTWSTAVILVAAVAIYWPTASSLLDTWTQTATYSHGLLVAGVSIWLLLSAAGRRKSWGVHHCPPFLLIGALAFCVLIWLSGFAADVATVHQLALPLILLALLACFLGSWVFRDFAVPIVSILLVIPAWDYLIPLLQRIAVVITQSVTMLMHIPVFVEGNMVIIPAGVFEIAEGCSGLRVFLAAIVLAVLAGEFGGLPLRRRFLLVGASICLALVANWFRILTIVIVGQFTNMQHPLIQHHRLFGDIVYVVFAVLPIVLLSRLEAARPQKHQGAATHSAAKVGGSPHHSMMLVAAIIGLALPASVRVWESQRFDGLSVTTHLPVAQSAWMWRQGTMPWRPHFPGAAQEAMGIYTADSGDEVYLYVVSYLDQAQGTELIGHYSKLMGAWNAGDSIPRSTGLDRPGDVSSISASSPKGARWAIWYWYQAGEFISHSETKSKLHQGMTWFGKPTATSLISLATLCNNSCVDATRTLNDFLINHPAVVNAVTLNKQQAR